MEPTLHGSDSGFANIDLDRNERIGMPEAVYAPQKTDAEILAIAEEMLVKSTAPVLITRVDLSQMTMLRSLESLGARLESFPSSGTTSPYYTVVLRTGPALDASVVIATAGTSDLRVAHEVEATLHALGVQSLLLADIGVAGLHRSLDALPTLRRADVVVVIAGMEGALASVIGGLVGAPVIAVPTSTGYGSSLEGITALLAMHASCAQGISVVGIDNGFGAASAAFRICARVSGARAPR